MADQVTPELLKSIYPLNQLPKAALDALMPHMRVRWQSSGRDLFRIGDTPPDYFYVLEGSVWLTDQKEEEFQTVGPVSEGDAIPLPYLVPSIHHANDSFPRGDGKLAGRVTATFGVAANGPAHSTEDLLKRADQALYRGKAAGRNAVVTAV